MISKNELKYFSSLYVKKFREMEKKFIAEGLKVVNEGLNSNYKCDALFVTSEFIHSFPDILKTIGNKTKIIYELSLIEFQKISNTKSPQGIAAVFNKTFPKENINTLDDKIIVLIDNVSDPGNLGTILRTCNWFGLKTILISNQSVEFLNPKVVRSSMGSIFHLNIYDNVVEKDFLLLKENGYKFYVSDIQGKNIFSFKPENKSVLSFSNESSGPSKIIKNICDEFITISGKGNAESLNVSSAAAIILSVVTNEP
jgi:TrmH family RNA methyltransferase